MSTETEIASTTLSVPGIWRGLAPFVFPEQGAWELFSKARHTSLADSCPYFDDFRSISGTLDNGNNVTLTLSSGQSNYFAQLYVSGPGRHDVWSETIFDLDECHELITDDFRCIVRLDFEGPAGQEWLRAEWITAMLEAGYVLDYGESLDESVGFSRYSHDEAVYHFTHFDRTDEGVVVTGYAAPQGGTEVPDGSYVINAGSVTTRKLSRELSRLERAADDYMVQA